MKRYIFILLQLGALNAAAQKLQPGFDKAQYTELMKVNIITSANPGYYDTMPKPEHFKLLYQSAPMGMDNLWDLWQDENNVVAISVRGTTKNTISWLANFYAGMIPAKGELQVNKGFLFKYQLASNPKAAVHAGWLLSLAYLSKDILSKIDSVYKTGTKDILLMGHSQGGGIVFLLTAYLYNLQKQGLLPTDIRFKTYCSAGPKPGNLYFAYEYEAMTQIGWAFNVVNSADWVPQTPFSIQTINDFNTTNPFSDAKAAMNRQGFIKGLALKYMYNRLDGITKRAMNRYIRNLGTRVGGMLKKSLPGFQPSKYYQSMNYARAGNTITLLADDEYYKSYPDSKTNFFIHHLHKPYLLLLEKLK